MNAQSLVPPPPMPGYVPAPWLKRPEPIAPLPPAFAGNSKAARLWARMFIDAFDSERPRWPSETEWARFPEVVAMVEELDRLDAELAREPDPRERDAIDEQIMEADAALRSLAQAIGAPRNWLSNVACTRTQLHPPPERQYGETVEQFEARLQEWRRHRAATS